MTFTRAERLDLLRGRAAQNVDVGLANIVREYPVSVMFTADGPAPYRTHRELHPSFFGSFDWHSCVELHWVIVRMLRHFPDLPNAEAARKQLSALLTEENIAQELAFLHTPDHGGWERPYGWGWLLTLQHDLETWDDPDGRRWAAAIEPLAKYMVEGFIKWLPKLTYAVRCGFHPNSAFSLARSFSYARLRTAGGDDRFEVLIRERARDWFGGDTDYPARYEPSGSDFLSAAMTEAELMSIVLEQAEFVVWLDRFLPGLAADWPEQLMYPAVVSDASDGHIAHLHGLNLSRAWAFCCVAEALPEGDARIPVLYAAARRHSEASLGMVSGSDYMVEHWLAAYAALLLG